jgi:general secretion pathway protein A
MFLEFYGLREQPFGVTPDPRFLYFGHSHREALASLYYGIETGRGFLALIAEPGMGKTTLLFQLLEKLRHSARTAFLFQTHCDSREFLRALMSDLGIQNPENDVGRMQEQLNSLLVREYHTGKRFVLIVDEAQNLDDTVLETVRMLSNFETPRAKLMQILLAGQPQLAEKLASAHLVQLRQRVSIVTRLTRFNQQETGAYILHRLRATGYTGQGLFTPEALAMVAAQSGGIPRNINNLCFHALTIGFAKGQKYIDAKTLREVIADLDLESLGFDADASTSVQSDPQPAPSLPASRVDLTMPMPAVVAPAVAARAAVKQDTEGRGYSSLRELTLPSRQVGVQLPMASTAPSLVAQQLAIDLQVAHKLDSEFRRDPAPDSLPVAAGPANIPAGPASLQQMTAASRQSAWPAVQQSPTRASTEVERSIFSQYIPQQKAKRTRKVGIGLWALCSLAVTAWLFLLGVIGNSLLGERSSSAAQALQTPSVNAAVTSAGTDPLSPGTLEVVADRDQTIGQISRRHLGRFDKQLENQIKKLNPELAYSAQVKAGQRIRLPRQVEVKARD